MQTSHKRKKAFTLTELLVVVIVIGVLSAVVLPKFSKVVETRKTTEAEELMSAVRTEQEKRCALDKSYVTSLTAVKDIVPSGTSKNYAYSLTSTGMEAQSKGKYGYTLKMPSYADGRICCENEAECAKLNKDYPLCSALIARADYRSGAECAGEPEEKQCTGSSTQSCGCNNGGTQTRTCDTSTGTWSSWSACSISDACSCEGESTRACGCQGKGTQTRTCNTSNGTWGEWGACSIADECECTGTKPEESQTCNDCGTQTRSVTCDTATGQWKTGNWNTCSKTEQECAGGCDESAKPADFDTSCGCGTMHISYICDEESRTWRSQSGACVLPEGACQGGTETQACTKNGQTGTQTRTCSSCHWGEWGECQVTECEYGTRSDGSCRELVMKYRPSSTGTATIPACPVASNPTMTSTDCRNLRCPSSGNTITYTVGSWDTTCDADTGPGHAYTGNVSAVKKEYGGSEWWHCVFTNFECRQDWEVYL